MRYALLALGFLLGHGLSAQDVIAFLDYMGRLYVFDRGVFTQIDHLKPEWIKVGGNKVVYSDAQADLKVYQNGKVTKIDDAAGTDVVVTDHLVGFSVAGMFKVFDDKPRLLSSVTGPHITEDSVAAFKDDRLQTVGAYYKGEIVVIEDQLAGNALLQWKAGDNLLAWVSAYDRKFKVFYQGQVIELCDLVTEMEFKCGLDMVAYRDMSDKSFKVFYKGTVYDLEGQMPQRYEVGKGVMAWLDLSGALKVFDGKLVHTAMGFEPQRWEVMDSLVVIEDRNFLNVFIQGRVQAVERFVPEQWQASWSYLAYVDVDRSLKVWRNGVSEVVVRGQPVQEFVLDRGLILARLNQNTAKVWWRGALYEH